MKTLSEPSTMPDNEYKARRVVVDFRHLCDSRHGLNFKLAHPHPVILKGWTHEGAAIVKMHPSYVLDVNPVHVDKQTHTGRYSTAEGLYRAFMSRLPAFDAVRSGLLCVALFRRSGIAAIAEAGKSLTADFGEVPGLIARNDDRGIMNPNRIRYANAIAARLFRSGEARCPHCSAGDWLETIAGQECQGCHKTWSDYPGMEGWI